MSKRELAPIHPGEILLEEFLDPMDISQYRLSKDISVDLGELMRLSMVSAPFLLILHFVSVIILA